MDLQGLLAVVTCVLFQARSPGPGSDMVTTSMEKLTIIVFSLPPPHRMKIANWHLSI